MDRERELATKTMEQQAATSYVKGLESQVRRLQTQISKLKEPSEAAQSNTVQNPQQVNNNPETTSIQPPPHPKTELWHILDMKIEFIISLLSKTCLLLYPHCPLHHLTQAIRYANAHGLMGRTQFPQRIRSRWLSFNTLRHLRAYPRHCTPTQKTLNPHSPSHPMPQHPCLI